MQVWNFNKLLGFANSPKLSIRWQFADESYCRQIVCVCLTILWGWRLKG